MRDLNYSNRSEDGEELKRDFEKIAEIIAREEFDVVALQEINSVSALNHLKDVLNKKYKNNSHIYQSVFGDGMPTHSKDPERYGFIWNEKRLRLINVKKGTNPGYYTNAGGIGLIRPPYYGRFTARGMLGGSNFELRLVNTHIINALRKEERIREFDVLVKQVLPRICDHQDISADGEIMPSYTFLLGDYNIPLNKDPRIFFKIDYITQTKYTGRKRNYITVQESPTSLRKVGTQKTIDECYANNYDHFSYEDELLNKLTLEPQRVEALSKYFECEDSAVEKLNAYRTKVSDHVPIRLSIDLRKRREER